MSDPRPDAALGFKFRPARFKRARVERANFLANVAAKKPVAHFGTHVERDRAFVFDGEIGNAFVGAEPVRPVEGVGRAGGQTFCAGAAAN